MMWIDGEYFDDPVVLRRKERAVAVADAIISNALNTIDLVNRNVPLDIIAIITNSRNATPYAIAGQPLFPPSGGTVIGVTNGS